MLTKIVARLYVELDKVSMYRFDLFLGAVFFVMALAARLPNLMLVPRYSDEGQEVLWALDIALGRRLPLTAGVNSYYGPLFAYLVALLFRVFGISLELPRLTAAIFGALTVVATFGLGRLVWNRPAGIVAAMLTMTCPALIVYGSHYGWSSSLVPFFATATLVALYAGVTQQKGWLVALGGVLAACSIQTHPTSAVLLLGLTLWSFQMLKRGQIKRRTIVATILFFLLGCAPMILTAIQSYSVFIANPQAYSGILAPTVAPAEYLNRWLGFAKVGGFFLGGGIGNATLVLRIEAVMIELLLIAGLILSWRIRIYFIPLVLVSSILVLPIFIREFSERYYLFLFPIAYVAIGILSAAAWQRSRNIAGDVPYAETALQGATRLIIPAALSVLVVFPLATLTRYYADAFATGQTNEEYFRLERVLESNGACRAPLFIEDAPRDFSTPVKIQSWYELHAVDYVLTLDHCPHSMLPKERINDTLSTIDRESWLVAVQSSDEEGFGQFTTDTVAVISAPPIESTSVPVMVYRISPTD